MRRGKGQLGCFTNGATKTGLSSFLGPGAEMKRHCKQKAQVFKTQQTSVSEVRESRE